jgi:hypothetical protein
MPFVWELDTSPFSSGDGTQPGRIVIRQVDDDSFELVEPFVFTAPDGREFPVRPEYLGRTDLASIPGFLGWFARRHGRHTPAALLHDQLITTEPERLPPSLRVTPVEADRLFREALLASDVALVKSYVMWAGAALVTRWWSGWGARIALVAWFALAVAGTAVLVAGLADAEWWWVAAALLAPVPASVLWGRQFGAGLIGGYAFWFVVAGSLPAWLVYQVYRGIEYLVLGLRRLRSQNRGESLPEPAPYEKR